MSQYPAYLSYFVKEFSGVSTATFKIPPQASAPLTAHKQMSFCLPTNTLVSCKDIRLIFSAKTIAGTNAAAARLPAAKSLIERIVVTAGGIQIDSGIANQNVLEQALDNMKVREPDPVDSHSQMVRNFNGYNDVKFGGTDGAAARTVAEEYNNNHGATQFAVDLGTFFRTVSPNMLSLDLMPEITVTIYTADNSVITSGQATGTLAEFTTAAAGATQATYEIHNYSLLVPCYSIDDGMYQKVVQARMADSGYLTCSWDGYDAFNDTFNGVTRCASAASSLDKIIAVFRNADYAAVKGAVKVSGYNNGLQTPQTSAAAGQPTVPLAMSQSATYILDQPSTYGGAKYLSAPMNFTSPMAHLPIKDAGGNDHSADREPELAWSINSVRYPQFNANLAAHYQLLKDSFEVDRTQCQSYLEWLTNRFQVALRLNLPQSTAMRAKSGLDLRGSNSSILLSNVSGDIKTGPAEMNVLLFLQSHRELRIGMGKTLQLIL